MASSIAENGREIKHCVTLGIDNGPDLCYPIAVLIHLKRFCVYTHAVNGHVFYVGMGTAHRAFHRADRNLRWRRIVKSKPIIEVEILEWFRTKRTAKIREAREIETRRPIANVKHVRGEYRETQRGPRYCEWIPRVQLRELLNWLALTSQ
jgi:hypothetical protein